MNWRGNMAHGFYEYDQDKGDRGLLFRCMAVDAL